MNRLQLDVRLLQRVTRGDAEAQDFLAFWTTYCHEIDDIMDGDRPDPRDQLKTFARACVLFAMPFYLRNLATLKQVVLNVTVNYADSLRWEKAGEEWRRQWADHHRHAALDMVLAVATICGGHEHAFNLTEELRTMCYHDHHNQEGKPV